MLLKISYKKIKSGARELAQLGKYSMHKYETWVQILSTHINQMWLCVAVNLLQSTPEVTGQLGEVKHGAPGSVRYPVSECKVGLERWLSGNSTGYYLYYKYRTWVCFPASPWWFISVCNSSLKGSSALFGPPWKPEMHMVHSMHVGTRPIKINE